MMHITAYYSSVDPAAAYTALAAVQDPAINTQGNNVRVSSSIPFLFGSAGLTAAAVYTGSQVRSPSLRTLNNLYVRPLVNAVVFGDPPEVMLFPRNPRSMVAAEDVQFWTDSTPAGGAEAHYGLVWYCDGVIDPVQGEIFTVGAASASTLTAGAWVNSNITFDQQLPSGSFQICGLRAEGANLIAARVVFPGGGGNEAFRPGVAACTSSAVVDPQYARFGQLGVFGTFNQDNPPTIDALGVTDTTQRLTLDLIKVA